MGLIETISIKKFLNSLHPVLRVYQIFSKSLVTYVEYCWFEINNFINNINKIKYNNIKKKHNSYF